MHRLSFSLINQFESKCKIVLFCIMALLCGEMSIAQTSTNAVYHKLEGEARLGYVIPTHDFLRGKNTLNRPIDYSISAHLRYSFQFCPDTRVGRIYGSPHQGIGISYYTFGAKEQLGNPIAIFLLQGARLAQFTRRLSLNYEWNFGLSGGWQPYDYKSNPENRIIGSKINAYMNTNFYLSQTLSRHLDLISGFSVTHFSNGNTQFPNAGLNTYGFKLGMAYHFNRTHIAPTSSFDLPIENFPRHISYDVLLFGSWRRKGLIFNEKPIASPHIYTVAGFNINPMYNVGYKLRAGLSLDGIYDSSANIYTEDYIYPLGGVDPGYTFYTPSVGKQLALGVSARAEYVMPYFTVGIGLGANILHGGGDLRGLYQILALKIEATRNSFIHIGYNLQNFRLPNYLMLGVGYRFNNKYPLLWRR